MIPSRAASLEPQTAPLATAERPSAPRVAPRAEGKADGWQLETWLRSEEEEIFDLPCTD